MSTLSVVLATHNEEENIESCLKSIEDVADEVIIFDEYSDDETCEIAKKYNAKIYKFRHKNNFHETKQKAIEKAKCDWILQLDADERVPEKLAKEINEVIGLNNKQLISRVSKDKHKNKLFERHSELISKREMGLGKNTGEVVAFFVPRVNYFLGKPLLHAGVYPDGVIRLFKRGYAYLPAKSVHELMRVDGEVKWLFNDLEHHESPTFSRYLKRANRYTDLTAGEFERRNLSTGISTLLFFSFIKPFTNFMLLYFRHAGFLDGMRGFIWSAFSSLHYPIAYFKYYQTKNN